MKYNSLFSAIPANWKRIIKQTTEENILNNIRLTNQPHLKLNDIIKPISKCGSKLNHIYQMLLKGHTATDTWVNIFPFLDKEITKQKKPYIESFQFKILNRIHRVRYCLVFL